MVPAEDSQAKVNLHIPQPRMLNWRRWYFHLLPFFKSLQTALLFLRATQSAAATSRAVLGAATQFFFFLIYFLFGRKLLYNVVLVSALWQCKSAFLPSGIPPFWANTERQAELRVLHSSFSPAVDFIRGGVPVLMLLSLSRFFLPPLCPEVCSLHLHPFPANRFINTVFLDSIYMR